MLVVIRNAPCRECSERYIGCHDKCRQYRDYKTKSLDIKKKRNRDAAPSKFIIGQSYNRQMEAKKRGIK